MSLNYVRAGQGPPLVLIHGAGVGVMCPRTTPVERHRESKVGGRGVGSAARPDTPGGVSIALKGLRMFGVERALAALGGAARTG